MYIRLCRSIFSDHYFLMVTIHGHTWDIYRRGQRIVCIEQS
jgi:hypothetical protein